MNESVFCTEPHYGASPCRPDLHGILIPGRRGRLLSVLYTAAGEGLHPTVLLLHGIPGWERNLDLAQALRRAGFHVLVFHYSGSWGSDGTYSLAHVLEDSHTALDYLLREAPFGVDRERIYVAGHSLGGFAAAHLLARRPEIRAGALLMPCDIGRLPVIAREDPAAFRTIRQILEDSGPWLTGTSGEALWREAEADSDTLRLESLAARLAEKPLLCIRGSLDTDTPPEQHCDPLLRCIRAAGGTRVQTVTLPTDHLSADHRLALAGAVTGFFTGQERENQNSFPADS